VVAAARRAAAPRCRSRSSGESRSARPCTRPSSSSIPAMTLGSRQLCV